MAEKKNQPAAPGVRPHPKPPEPKAPVIRGSAAPEVEVKLVKEDQLKLRRSPNSQSDNA